MNFLTDSKITNQDELLHEIQKDNWNWIETSWFGNIPIEPEPGRHVVICPYVQMRMTAGVAWTGIVVWEGIIDHHVKAKYCNHSMWGPIPEGDFDEKGMTFDTGLSIKMLEPGKVFQVDFVDEAADTEFHFTWTAVSPRFPWISDDHFDQVGKVKGYLILRGERMEFDTYNVRDRGWAPRSDARVPNAPSFDHLSAIIDEKNAFTVFGFDKSTVKIGTDAKPSFTAQIPDMEFLPTSWRLKDGVPKRIRSYECHVKRAENGWMQDELVGTIIDEDYDELKITAKIVALLPFSFPQNNITTITVAKGEINGVPFVGKWDEALDNDTMLYLLEKYGTQ